MLTTLENVIKGQLEFCEKEKSEWSNRINNGNLEVVQLQRACENRMYWSGRVNSFKNALDEISILKSVEEALCSDAPGETAPTS